MSSISSSTKHHTTTSSDKQRPDLHHAAATVTPTINSTHSHDPEALRHRAAASPDCPKSSVGLSLQRRRADTSTSRTLPNNPGPLNLDLDLASLNLPPSVPTPTSTAPIAIPQRKDKSERPTTPLSGRPRDFTHSDSVEYQALKARYSAQFSESSSDKSISPTQNRVAESLAMTSRSSQQPPPSSPLSPSRPHFTFAQEQRQPPRRPQQKLNLTGLGRYHPVNFQKTADSNVPSPSRNTRGIASQSRGSDAQQKLQQYQRDVVANFTRASQSAHSPNPSSTPISPRLDPRGSPGGQITPLMLENQGDYLLAGSGLSATSPGGRELVERLVQKENERRQNHPDARSGSLSPALSPNISPAVSPAGGLG